jgi:hypothetical protein
MAASSRLHHYQDEAHHDAGSGNCPADPMRAVFFCLPNGVYWLFLSHDLPAFEKHATAD